MGFSGKKSEVGIPTLVGELSRNSDLGGRIPTSGGAGSAGWRLLCQAGGAPGWSFYAGAPTPGRWRARYRSLRAAPRTFVYYLKPKKEMFHIRSDEPQLLEAHPGADLHTPTSDEERVESAVGFVELRPRTISTWYSFCISNFLDVSVSSTRCQPLKQAKRVS